MRRAVATPEDASPVFRSVVRRLKVRGPGRCCGQDKPFQHCRGKRCCESKDLVRGNIHASLRTRRQPEAARSVLAGAGADPAGQRASRGLPAVPLHDPPQRSARRGFGRARASCQDRPRLEGDGRRGRAGDDGAGRRRGRGRAPERNDQGVAPGPPGPPSQSEGPQNVLPPASVQQPDTAGGMAPAEPGEPRRQRYDLGRPVASALPDHRGIARVGPVRSPERAESRDCRGRVPARHAGRVRDAGVPTGEMASHVRLLRQDRRPAPGRAHPPAEPGRLRPGADRRPRGPGRAPAARPRGVSRLLGRWRAAAPRRRPGARRGTPPRPASPGPGREPGRP